MEKNIFIRVLSEDREAESRKFIPLPDVDMVGYEKIFTFEQYLKNFKKRQLYKMLHPDTPEKKMPISEDLEFDKAEKRTPDYLLQFVHRSLRKEKSLKPTLRIVLPSTMDSGIRFLQNVVDGFLLATTQTNMVPARGGEMAGQKVTLLDASMKNAEDNSPLLRYQFIKDGERSVLLTILMDRELSGKKTVFLYANDRLIKTYETYQNTAFFPNILTGQYSIRVNANTGTVISETGIEIYQN